MCLWQQTSANPIKSRLPRTHTHTYICALSPPLCISRDQTRGLGKRWPTFAPLPCPCIQLREVMELAYTPRSTPTPFFCGLSPSPAASITFEDEGPNAGILEGMFQFKIKLIKRKGKNGLEARQCRVTDRERWGDLLKLMPQARQHQHRAGLHMFVCGSVRVCKNWSVTISQ